MDKTQDIWCFNLQRKSPFTGDDNNKLKDDDGVWMVPQQQEPQQLHQLRNGKTILYNKQSHKTAALFVTSHTITVRLMSDGGMEEGPV